MKEENKLDLKNIKMTEKEMYPCIDDEKYYNLLKRFMFSIYNDSNEFIISEAIQIYADLGDDEHELKVRILELLKDVRY